MKRGWAAVLVVGVAAAGIIAYKERSPKTSREVVTEARQPAVLLFADPVEAASACGCGQIIRLVRAAAERGVAVREAAPASDPALEKKYRVTVAPTVLLLDSQGDVTTRHEGEAPETIEAIRVDLDRLEKAR